MGPRRVVMLAIPCAEVVEVGGVLDILYAVNQRLGRAGASDQGYAAPSTQTEEEKNHGSVFFDRDPRCHRSGD
jgi:hypothetical protein